MSLFQHPLFALRRSRWTRPLLRAFDFTVFRRPAGLGFPIAVRAFRNHGLFSSSFAEPETTGLVRRLARTNKVFTFVDVGANVGFFSWLVLTHNPAARVIAIEPDLLNNACLRRTAARHPQFAVTIFDCAVAATAGQATFHTDELSSVTGTLVGSRPTADVSLYAAKQKQLSVRTETLDTLLDGRLEGTTCLKVDVEGAELDVLAGARHLLASCRPHLIIECTEAQRADLLALLEEFRYEVTGPRLDPHGDVTNIAARPR
jgi:FkbM family methyltransferase